MARWTDEQLDLARQTADGPADHVVETLFASGQIDRVNAALLHLTGNAQTLPDPLPAVLRDYLLHSAELPPDLDLARLRRGQDFFVRNGPVFGIALMYASLPSLYAGAQGGAQILAMTGQLTDHFQRRASETLRFILDVMQPGGLDPKGRGIRTAQKVRLMHATIRHFARRSGRWRGLPAWGMPINQEELAGTLMAFSIVAADNIRRLGAEAGDGEIEDYLYAWHVIGHLIGIVPELRPLDAGSARALWKRVAQRNFARTEDGIKLTHSHMQFLDKLVPAKAIDGMNGALMRYLMGYRIAIRYLGLPVPGLWSAALFVLKAVFRISSRFLPTQGELNKLIEEIHYQLMNELQRHWASGDSRPFQLPTQMPPLAGKPPIPIGK